MICCSNQSHWSYEFHLLNSAFSYVLYEVANTIFVIENTMFTFRCKHVYYVPNGKYKCTIDLIMNIIIMFMMEI